MITLMEYLIDTLGKQYTSSRKFIILYYNYVHLPLATAVRYMVWSFMEAHTSNMTNIYKYLQQMLFL